MIIVVKDILQECLCFHVLELSAAVGIVLVKDGLDVLDSQSLALVSLLLLALHILVEDVGREQVGKEVEAHQHEEHEQEGVPEVYVHGWKENVGEVRSCEQNSHISVGILNSAEVLEALKAGSVEIVYCEHKDQDIGEDGHQDCK